MIEHEDQKTLRAMKRLREKKKKSFNDVINSKILTDEDLDELFLS